MDFFELIFPRICIGCKKPGAYVCNYCLQNASKVKQKCAECNKNSIDGVTHAKCQKRLGLSGLITIWAYQGVIRNAILSFKYKYAFQVGEELSKLVIKELLSYRIIFPANSLLIPIPLYWYRENLRGYNQSLKIATNISGSFEWKLIADLLVRTKITTPQAQLKRKDRIKNVHGIFSFNEKYRGQLSRFDKCIIIDDVYTTGSTIKEASRVLKTNGAKEVWGITIAR